MLIFDITDPYNKLSMVTIERERERDVIKIVTLIMSLNFYCTCVVARDKLGQVSKALKK